MSIGLQLQLASYAFPTHHFYFGPAHSLNPVKQRTLSLFFPPETRSRPKSVLCQRAKCYRSHLVDSGRTCVGPEWHRLLLAPVEFQERSFVLPTKSNSFHFADLCNQ